MAEQTPQIVRHNWGTAPEILAYCTALAQQSGKRILELGPGKSPFPVASEFVVWKASEELSGKKVHVLDFDEGKLPFANKEFDFVYCHHLIQDLQNPLPLLKEISRVSKAGYIETPSPLAECCRGVDGGAPAWRGYHQHRFIIWVANDSLCLIPKYPIIEHLQFEETRLIQFLNQGALHWNSYFFWKNSLPLRLLRHDHEFRVTVDYPAKLQEAMNECLKSNERLYRLLKEKK